eukprot:3316387-Prorocentrum_lima.AAC.1
MALVVWVWTAGPETEAPLMAVRWGVDWGTIDVMQLSRCISHGVCGGPWGSGGVRGPPLRG